MFFRNDRIVLVVLLAAMLACNLPVPAPASPIGQPTPILTTASPPPSQTALPASIPYQPVFEAASCAFPIPSGYNPECGYLVVPENRLNPGTRYIRLHVAIFRNRAGAAVADPVIHLAGGPGSSSLEVAGYMLGQGLDAILNQHDFILFDQRGTGYSLPRLDCPERVEVTATLLEIGLTSPGANELIVEAFRRCRERLLAEGTDLSAYNSAVSATDLNDLRVALGYEALNLYGVSYGTRLALTFMRDYPQAVRSAVLDSTYPLEVNLYTALAPNAERAFNVFFERCTSDPGCNAAYPELGTVFYQLVDRLNAAPVTISMYAAGVERSVHLDGGLLIDVLFLGLYNPAVTASMPEMIYDVRSADYTLLRERLALYFSTSSALGMQMAVQCSEEFPFNLAEEAYTAAQNVQSQIAAFYPASVQPLFEACREWISVLPDARENAPVVSDVPVLVLAGDHDPITPPDWGRVVAGQLTRSYYYEFPGHGHWVTRSSRCALQMSLAFWRDPAADPGHVCQ
ncbi:MAG TPA: alpha/beta fold hydrolase [Anaerolineales bacterium]|nr:alpha/beta fold hydrolase [Anaerolineales bacterium]